MYRIYLTSHDASVLREGAVPDTDNVDISQTMQLTSRQQWGICICILPGAREVAGTRGSVAEGLGDRPWKSTGLRLDRPSLRPSWQGQSTRDRAENLVSSPASSGHQHPVGSQAEPGPGWVFTPQIPASVHREFLKVN